MTEKRAKQPDGQLWPSGTATGLGSLPGTNVAEAQRIVLGELPGLPHLVELPDRGPGADLIGRGAAILTDLPVELYAARWRLAQRPGRDLRIAHDLLERDLDTLTEQASEYAGDLKVQIVGPWTLAACVDLPVGGVALRDPGAARDLAASLADGARRHVEQLRARLPRARILVQLDEPALPAVLAGRVPTESGLGTLRAVPAEPARSALAAVIDAAAAPVVAHCCAENPPLGLFRAAGAAAVAIDLSIRTSAAALDELGSALDAGLGLLAGVVPADRSAGALPTAGDLVVQVRGFWRDLGFPLERLPGQVAVTPTCGLAGASPARARAAMTVCREAARRLLDS